MLAEDSTTATARVEFDRNGDGIPEASFVLNAAGTEFLYDPRETDSSLVGLPHWTSRTISYMDYRIGHNVRRHCLHQFLALAGGLASAEATPFPTLGENTVKS